MGHAAHALHDDHGPRRRDGYSRRRPEEGALYQTVAERWPAFRDAALRLNVHLHAYLPALFGAVRWVETAATAESARDLFRSIFDLTGTIAIDFLPVPTVTFNVPYVFFALSLERPRILHVNVTAHPYAAWAAQRIVEAVDLDTSFVRLVRDRDGIHGRVFDARVNNLGIRHHKIAPRSPWQMAARNASWGPCESCSTT